MFAFYLSEATLANHVMVFEMSSIDLYSWNIRNRCAYSNLQDSSNVFRLLEFFTAQLPIAAFDL